MATVLSFKNQLLDSLISARPLNGFPFPDTNKLSNSDINLIMNTDVFYYMKNSLVLRVAPEATDTNIFTFDNIQTGRFRMASFWKINNSPSAIFDFDNFVLIETFFNIDSINQNSVVISYSDSEIARIIARITNSSNAFKPDFGIMAMNIPFISPDGQETVSTYAFKITHRNVFETVLAPPPQTTENNIYRSPSYTFETFFIPNLTGTFVYNFFEPQEENFDTVKNRDYSRSFQRDIPKFVKLNWSGAPLYIPPVRNELSGTNPTNQSSQGNSNVLYIDGTVVSTTDAAQEGNIAGSDQRSAEIFEGGGRGGDFNPFGNPFGFTEAEATSSTTSPLIAGRVSTGAPGAPETNSTPPPQATDDFMTNATQPNGTVIGSLQSDYVGYVIQKEVYDDLSGTFSPTDLIIINSRNSVEWVDWKVAYGEIYRYQVRSVFRFINDDNLTMFQDSDQSQIPNPNVIFTSSRATFTEPNQVFYFDSKFSNKVEVEAIDLVRPFSPFNVQVYPNSLTKKIFLTWNQKNPNIDVLGFNVYRKDKINSFFKKLNSDILDIRNNFFMDQSVDFDLEYIYTIESVDIHNNFSTLSDQISTKLIKQNNNNFRQENQSKFEDAFGEELIDQNNEVELTPNDVDNIEFTKNNFSIQINPLFNNLQVDNTYLLRMTSLDTNITKEAKINFQINTIYHRNQQQTGDDRFMTEDLHAQPDPRQIPGQFRR